MTEKTSPANVSELTDRLITRLWEKMGQVYGYRWGSCYGQATDGDKITETALLWKKGLHDITAEQIAQGLSRCVERSDPWPPSLPEFRALCRGDGFQHPQNASAYQRPECLALPPPRADKSTARAMLEKIKRALR